MGLAQPRQRLGQDNPSAYQTQDASPVLEPEGRHPPGSQVGQSNPSVATTPARLGSNQPWGSHEPQAMVGIGNPTLARTRRACGQTNLPVQVDHKRWWVSATQPLPAPRERPG